MKFPKNNSLGSSHQRGQAMLEFVMLLPLFLLVFVWITALAPVLDLRQRVTSATWYVLRGQSVDSAHRSGANFENDVKTKLFPDYPGKVQVNVDDKMDWLAGPLQVLDVVTWYIIPKDKCVTVQVNNVPYYTPTFGGSVNKGSVTITSHTSKMIFNTVNPP